MQKAVQWQFCKLNSIQAVGWAEKVMMLKLRAHVWTFIAAFEFQFKFQIWTQIWLSKRGKAATFCHSWKTTEREGLPSDNTEGHSRRGRRGGAGGSTNCATMAPREKQWKKNLESKNAVNGEEREDTEKEGEEEEVVEEKETKTREHHHGEEEEKIEEEKTSTRWEGRGLKSNAMEETIDLHSEVSREHCRPFMRQPNNLSKTTVNRLILPIWQLFRFAFSSFLL